jgi:hypothetical protein
VAKIIYYKPRFVECSISTLSPRFTSCCRRAEFTLVKESEVEYNLCIDHAVMLIEIARALDISLTVPVGLKNR